jgi:hypothetical protein
MNLNKLYKTLVAPTRELKEELWYHATIKGIDHCLYLPEITTNRICLVAHIDTVHKNSEQKVKHSQVYHDKKYNTLWNPTGLGADDRSGIYAIMDIYESLPADKKPLLLITDKEETGMVGAYEATEEAILKDISFFIQLDRRNKKDAIFYNGESKDFQEYILKYGFKKGIGSFSDISVICPFFGIAGVNLSCGYYMEHTTNEILNYRQLENTIIKTKRIIIEHDGTKHQVEQDINEYHSDKYYYQQWLQWEKEDEEYHRRIEKSDFIDCHFCGAKIPREHLSGYDYLCPDCSADLIRTYYD